MALQDSVSSRVRAHSRVSATLRGVRAPTDSFVFAGSLVLILVTAALDVTNYLDRGGRLRYLLLLVPVGSIVLVRFRNPSTLIRRPFPADRILMLLLAFGLPGTVYGIMFRGTSATALPIFVPMLIAFLYLATVEQPTKREVRAIHQGIEWVGILYLGLAALVSTEVLPGLAEFGQFRNSSLIFVGLGIASTITLRHWGRAILVGGLWAVLFWAYPSGTSVLFALAVAFTLLMTPRRPSRLRPYLLAAAGAAAVAIVILNFSTGIQLSNDYFSLVGKTNNNSGRLAIWEAGMQRFGDSPIYGEVFSGPGVTTTVPAGGGRELQIPYHNDYIHFLANGGVIGLGLLLLWIAVTELTVLRRYVGLVEMGDRPQAGLLRTLLVGFNGFFVTAAFNPTIVAVSGASTIFSIYALMMMLGYLREERLE